ncbi:unnamed protein product [Lactuca saligna]|uniref:Uncharacterized protein n=1 Tax=Lactuca saligna TaxID=75948 RepID=A0AA35ZP30_LACSI|nr:unnamed protein product [Lactuca saligna]
MEVINGSYNLLPNTPSNSYSRIFRKTTTFPMTNFDNFNSKSFIVIKKPPLPFIKKIEGFIVSWDNDLGALDHSDYRQNRALLAHPTKTLSLRISLLHTPRNRRKITGGDNNHTPSLPSPSLKTQIFHRQPRFIIHLLFLQLQFEGLSG